jgi:ABC-type glutathione transport system ATPase component
VKADALLSFRVSLDYPGHAGALRDVHLEIGPGEIVGLVGESGSGKSTIALTLLRLSSLKGAMISRAKICSRSQRQSCGAFVAAG